jgi:hypothetical protein
MFASILVGHHHDREPIGDHHQIHADVGYKMMLMVVHAQSCWFVVTISVSVHISVYKKKSGNRGKTK